MAEALVASVLLSSALSVKASRDQAAAQKRAAKAQAESQRKAREFAERPRARRQATPTGLAKGGTILTDQTSLGNTSVAVPKPTLLGQGQ